MLELINLNKTYKPQKGQPVQALKNVSIKFEEKGLVFILGKSGSGKSTLLNVVGGLDAMDSGEIIIKGRSSKTFSGSDFDSYRNTFIGFIFQEYNILSEFNVEKNIALALELQGKNATPEIINSILEEVDLQGYNKRKITELSGGQKQRVAIARALIKDPEIIFADEPTGALDSTTGIQVFETLKKLSKKKLVIVVSHDREFAEQYADRIIEMKDGEIFSDNIKTLKDLPQPKELTGGVKLINDNLIQIEKDHQLTDKEIDYIIKQLKKHKTGAIISTDEKNNSTFKNVANIDETGKIAQFKDTNPEKDLDIKKYDGSELKLIKSKLKNYDAFKIGASGLKIKKVRLFFTILLSVISLAVFGFIDTLSAYDEASSHAQSIVTEGITQFQVSKVQNATDVLYSGFNYKLNEDDLSYLQSKPNINAIPLYDELFGVKNQSFGLSSLYTLPDIFRINPEFSFITDSDFLQKYDLTLLAGNLPQNDKEILITDYQYYLLSISNFTHYNVEDDNYVFFTPTQYSQVLNKKLNNKGYYISGIVKTDFDFDKYTTQEYLNTTDYDVMNEVETYISGGIYNIFFYHKDAKDTLYVSEFINGVSLSAKVNEYYSQTIPFYIDINDIDEFDYVLFNGGSNLQNEAVVSLRTALSFAFGDFMSIEYVEDEWSYVKVLRITDGNTNYDFESMEDFGLWLENEANQNTLNRLINEKGKKIELRTIEYSLEVNVGGIYLTNFDAIKYGLFENIDDSTSIVTLGRNAENKLNIKTGNIKKVNVSINGNETQRYNAIYSILSYNSNGASFEINSQFNSTFTMLRMMFSFFRTAFLVIAIVFGVFSALLMMNFIATSISHKKREIGVLRAVGARGYDVFKIFTFESLLIATINAIVGIVAVIPFIIWMNSYVQEQMKTSITLLLFGVRQISIIFAVAIGSAIISSLLPVLNITRKQPIDAINNR